MGPDPLAMLTEHGGPGAKTVLGRGAARAVSIWGHMGPRQLLGAKSTHLKSFPESEEALGVPGHWGAER